MNSAWLKRNWPLVIIGAILVIGIIKKIVSKLPDYNLSGLNTNFDTNYIMITIMMIVGAIAFGNKLIKTSGLVVAVLLALFFTEEIVNFNWTSISFGRAIERQFGAGTAMWIWALLGIVALIYFGNKVSGAAAHGILVIFCVAGLMFTLAKSLVGTDKVIDGLTVMTGGQPKDGGIDCLNEEKAKDMVFYPDRSKNITICPSSGLLIINTRSGTLNFKFSKTFAAENEEVLSGVSMEDFVKINPPHSFLGSNSVSYQLVTRSTTAPKGTDAFQETGLNHVEITVTGN